MLQGLVSLFQNFDERESFWPNHKAGEMFAATMSRAALPTSNNRCMYRHNRPLFDIKAKEWVRRYALQESSYEGGGGEQRPKTPPRMRVGFADSPPSKQQAAAGGASMPGKRMRPVIKMEEGVVKVKSEQV